MNLIVDSREKDRIRTSRLYYEKYYPDLIIEKAKLEVGDYLFNNLVAFEFKTADDFVSSCINHRIIPQLINQVKAYPYSFLIISGLINQAIEKNTKIIVKKYRKNYVKELEYRKNLVYHILRVIRMICPVIQSHNDFSSFEVMYKQAKTCLNNKDSFQKTYTTVKTSNPAVNFLCGENEVGVKTAELICNTYNITNLKDLLGLNKEKLVSIKGIKDKKADLIMNMIK